MKKIILICWFFLLTVSSVKGQYNRYHKVSDMLSEQGIEQTIITLDSILHIYFNSPYDTLTQEFIWYGNEDTYSLTNDAITVRGNNALHPSFIYCTIFMRAYYWMWLISENFTTLKDSLENSPTDERAILIDTMGHIVFDYHISDKSYREYGQKNRLSDSPISFYPDWQFTIIPLYDSKKTLYKIDEQYKLWFKVVKEKGLITMRKKNIALLPAGYKWEKIK